MNFTAGLKIRNGIWQRNKLCQIRCHVNLRHERSAEVNKNNNKLKQPRTKYNDSFSQYAKLYTNLNIVHLSASVRKYI